MRPWDKDPDYWLDRFGAAALDSGLWMAVLAEMADATGSARGQLIGVGGDSTASFNLVTAFTAEAHREIESFGGHSPAINFRVAADSLAQPGSIVHEGHYDRARSTRLNDDYTDFCADHDIEFGCQTALLIDGDSLVGLALLRARADGPSDDAAHALFARVARAARTAVRIQLAIEGQGAKLLAGALDAMHLDALLLDGQGRVCAMTEGGERQIATNVLTLTERRLGAADPAVSREIDRAVGAMLAGAAHARIMLGKERFGGRQLDLFRLPRQEWALGAGPRLIAVLRDPHSRALLGADALAGIFGLSRAEAEVVALLGNGMARERIAAERSVSLETLRSQIKSIYLKTGCSREAELIALLNSATA